jgi:hypothetical protein
MDVINMVTGRSAPTLAHFVRLSWEILIHTLVDQGHYARPLWIEVVPRREGNLLGD